MEPNVFKITNLKRCNTFIQITKLIFYNVVCCLAWFLFRGLGCGVPLGFRLGPLGRLGGWCVVRPPRASLRGCLPSLRVALALGRICTLLGAVRPVGPGGVFGGASHFGFWGRGCVG